MKACGSGMAYEPAFSGKEFGSITCISEGTDRRGRSASSSGAALLERNRPGGGLGLRGDGGRRLCHPRNVPSCTRLKQLPVYEQHDPTGEPGA